MVVYIFIGAAFHMKKDLSAFFWQVKSIHTTPPTNPIINFLRTLVNRRIIKKDKFAKR